MNSSLRGIPRELYNTYLDFPVKARTPDSGCINSPPATDQHERTENINDNIRTDNADDDEEDDTLNMEDVFKSIISDLDPDTGDNVPLYMRGAGPSPQDCVGMNNRCIKYQS